jgi:hypothetical protein
VIPLTHSDKDKTYYGAAIQHSNFLQKSGDFSRQKGTPNTGPTQAGFGANRA